MLLTFPSTSVSARISTLSYMTARWVSGCLAVETRFGRSLRRALSVHLLLLLLLLLWILLRLLGCCGLCTRSLVSVRCCIPIRRTVTSIQMLLVTWWCISASASLAPSVLISNRAVLWRGIWMSSSVALGASNWGGWCLGGTSFDFVGG